MNILSAKSAMLCGAATLTLLASVPALAEVRSFNIPSEDANKAIPEFARQAGIGIVAPGDRLRGVRTPSVNGELDTQAALTSLLTGTGLEVAANDGTVITLRHASPNVLAADVSDAGGAAVTDSGALQLETIIVTSDRAGYSKELAQVGSFRGSRILDTPLTITVIPRELLDSQQAMSVLDAMRNTSGVTIAQVTPTVYSNVAIRGILVNTVTNYRLDGRLSIINMVDLPLEDKNRVEALKGASALYYGFTNPGGIINLTMSRPTDNPLTNVQLFGNEYGGSGIHLDISRTTEDGKLGVRANAVYATVNYGLSHSSGTRYLGSVALDYKPIENLTISVDAERIFKQMPEPGIFRFFTTASVPSPTVANPYPAIAIPDIKTLNPSVNFGPSWDKNRALENNMNISASYNFFDTWNLDLSYGWSQLKRNRMFNYLEPRPALATPGAGVLTVVYQDAYYVNTTSRAQLAGTFATGPFVHDLLLGVSQNLNNNLAPPSATYNTFTFNTNYLNPVDPVQPVHPAMAATDTLQSRDIGYYAFDRVKLYGDYLQFIGGVRMSNFTQADHATHTQTYHTTPTSYSGGLIVKPLVDWATVYATYIDGLQPTSAAPGTAANAGQTFPATVSTQNEIGVKLEPWKGLLFQASYFTIKQGATYLNAANVYVLDGKMGFRGLEAGLNGEITDDFSVYASALLLNAKFLSGAPTTVTTNPVTKVVTVSPTNVGKLVDNAPKVSYSLAGEYRLTQWVEGLAFNGGLQYVGSRAINPANQAIVPGYMTFNLGVSYSLDAFGYPTRLQLNAENITGKRYWASTQSALLAQGTPSVVKFEISTQFE